jgi:hypothetical protein
MKIKPLPAATRNEAARATAVSPVRRRTSQYIAAAVAHQKSTLTAT